jgi:hypothetical protein
MTTTKKPIPLTVSNYQRAEKNYILKDYASGLFLVDATFDGKVTLSGNARHAMTFCDEAAGRHVIKTMTATFGAFAFEPVSAQ